MKDEWSSKKTEENIGERREKEIWKLKKKKKKKNIREEKEEEVKQKRSNRRKTFRNKK